MDITKLENRANEIIDYLCQKYRIKRSDVVLKTYTTLDKRNITNGSASYL